MKLLQKGMAIAVALVILILSGCSQTSSLDINENRLLGLIGKTKAAACEALDFSENALTALDGQNNVYQAPTTVKYKGLDFSLLLSFDINNGQLWRIELVREYSEMSEACAKDIVKIAKDMVSQNGEPKQGPQKGWGADTVEENEIPDLYQKIINGPYSEKYMWNLTDQAPENVKKCMEDIGSTQFINVLYWDRNTERKITPLTIVWQIKG